MGSLIPICIALSLAGTLQVSANVIDMRCGYRVDPIKSKHTLRICLPLIVSIANFSLILHIQKYLHLIMTK